MASTVQTYHELVKQPHDPLPEGRAPTGITESLEITITAAAGRRVIAVKRRFASAAGHDVEFACQHTIQAACAPVAHGVSNER